MGVLFAFGPSVIKVSDIYKSGSELSLNVLSLRGVFLFTVGNDVAVLVGLIIKNFLFSFGGRHLGGVLFPPFGAPVLKPYLKNTNRFISFISTISIQINFIDLINYYS